jgi:hypothetical protein
VLNIVDDQPVPVREWLPAMATRLAGAANTRARQQLDWKPTYSNWQDGLAATPPTG